MKITDLAALVTVRNHINTVMGDKTVSGKDDFRPLSDARIKLDKKFIAALREHDVESLFSQNTVVYFNDPNLIAADPSPIISSQTTETVVSSTPLILELPDDSTGIWEDSETAEPEKESVEISLSTSQPVTAEVEDSEAAELALIAERVKAQKEQLKKEGRSNKRKPKEDDAPQ